MIPLFVPKNSTPLRLAIFGSGSGTTLEALLAAPSSTYQISLAFADRPCRFQEIAQTAALPLLSYSYDAFLSKRGFARKDPAARIAFDEQLVQLLSPCIDLILLAGYMRILSTPLLQRFHNRIINTHPGDLAALDAHGQRKYIGADAVQKALGASESRTRSCVILVDENIDAGPVLVSGPWTPHQMGDSAQEHQKKQKQISDYPACLAALQWISEGRFALGLAGQVYFDGKPQPPCGVDLQPRGERLCAASLA